MIADDGDEQARLAEARWAARAESAESALEELTAAVAAMAVKYDARRAGKNPIQWVEEVCRRLDALREAAAQDGREKVRLLAELDAARLVVKEVRAVTWEFSVTHPLNRAIAAWSRLQEKRP